MLLLSHTGFLGGCICACMWKSQPATCGWLWLSQGLVIETLKSSEKNEHPQQCNSWEMINSNRWIKLWIYNLLDIIGLEIPKSRIEITLNIQHLNKVSQGISESHIDVPMLDILWIYHFCQNLAIFVGFGHTGCIANNVPLCTGISTGLIFGTETGIWCEGLHDVMICRYSPAGTW